MLRSTARRRLRAISRVSMPANLNPHQLARSPAGGRAREHAMIETYTLIGVMVLLAVSECATRAFWGAGRKFWLAALLCSNGVAVAFCIMQASFLAVVRRFQSPRVRQSRQFPISPRTSESQRRNLGVRRFIGAFAASGQPPCKRSANQGPRTPMNRPENQSADESTHSQIGPLVPRRSVASPCTSRERVACLSRTGTSAPLCKRLTSAAAGGGGEGQTTQHHRARLGDG